MSFQMFERYVKEEVGKAEFEISHVLNQMKEIVILTFKAIESSMSGGWFELFGYDFMVDELFKVWLIEVNTNPWIEESSKLLEAYIPRIINDALKLTIDIDFKKKYPEQEQELNIKNKRIFPVEGYEDDDNFWEHIYTIKI